MRIPELLGQGPISSWTAELSRVLKHAFRSIDHQLETLALDIKDLGRDRLTTLPSYDPGTLPSDVQDGTLVIAIDALGDPVPVFYWDGQWWRMNGDPL